VVSVTPQERAAGTHWIGGWVNLRAGLDDMEKEKFLALPGLELRSLGYRARSHRLRYPSSYRLLLFLLLSSLLYNLKNLNVSLSKLNKKYI
jgi:hypothetical protein